MTNSQPLIKDTHSKERSTQACHSEAELLLLYGSHTLAFFGLAPENKHFLVSDGTGLVNYQLTGKVVVVLGDPVCAPEAREQVLRQFLDFCASHHWNVAFYQASPEHLAIYRALKLRVFKMGEEAILDLRTFTLRGSALANVRTSCRRAQREGVTIRWYEGVPSMEVMQQLKHISSIWLGSKAGKGAEEMGFSMGKLDELIEIAKRAETIASVEMPTNVVLSAAPRLVTAVATTSTGQACAFVTFTPIYGCLIDEVVMTGEQSELHGWGYTLDLMRRVPDAPPGVMELLLVQAIERFRERGAHRVSRGLVAMADTGQEMAPVERRLARFATYRLGLLESRQTLFNFKQKFHPCWESRYLITNTTLALPRVVLAVHRLRNYSRKGLVGLITRWIAW
jgi:lysylphosphatidylglycerol synthetase-like protein (DUF2156 family)